MNEDEEEGIPAFTMPKDFMEPTASPMVQPESLLEPQNPEATGKSRNDHYRCLHFISDTIRNSTNDRKSNAYWEIVM